MNKKKISEVLLALFPVILIVINQLFLYFGNKRLFELYQFQPFHSIIIVYSFLLLFVFITKSFKKSNKIILIISFILVIINQIKMYYMQEPIYLSDIKLLGGIKDIFDITGGTLLKSILNTWYLFLILIILYIGIFIGIKYCEDKVIDSHKYYYLIPSIILVILALPISFISKFTKNTIYANIKLNDYNTYSSNAFVNMYFGLSGSMYYNLINNRVYEPDNYNIEEINKVLNYKVNKDNYSNEDYNIILLFSESFFDITKLDEIEFSDNVLKDYHDLSKEGKLLQMISPTYGGRSCNVEMELLTSFNLAYYDSTYTPVLISVNIRNYAVVYVRSRAVMTLLVPFIVALMYGSIALRLEWEVICMIRSVLTPSLRAVTMNVLRAVCEHRSRRGVLTSIFWFRRYS